MKVLINHKQHLLLIEENQRWDKFIQYFTTSTVNKNVDEWLNDFFNTFSLNRETLLNSETLYNIFLNFFRKNVDYYSNNLMKYGNKIEEVFDLISEKETNKILNSKNTPLEKIKQLLFLERKFPWRYENVILGETIDGLLYDVVEYLFKNYNPTDAIKQLSIIKDKMGENRIKNIVPLVKDFAEKNGLTIIPKHKGFTFQKGDESRIRDLINYIKDKPELPKKTKRGFLNYIGQTDSGGQLSTFWSAANQSGIIQKVGGGNNISYELGPNYKDWEEGRVVAF
jgi:hypothetical protein